MGLYDYLHCKYPLPVDGANALEYQTKDTPKQWLDHYEISEYGQLIGEEYEIEDRSDKSAKGFMAMVGIMTRVNVRQVPVSFTGEIRFYTTTWDKWWSDKKLDPGWLEFSSYFVDGKIKELHVIQNLAPTTNQGGNVKLLPQYQCHKTVRAGKISAMRGNGDGTHALEFEGFGPGECIDVPAAFMSQHAPEVGGYFVEYEPDGYQSYSPAAVFEAGYTLIKE